jgi:hypothetical protein
MPGVATILAPQTPSGDSRNEAFGCDFGIEQAFSAMPGLGEHSLVYFHHALASQARTLLKVVLILFASRGTSASLLCLSGFSALSIDPMARSSSLNGSP